MDHRYWANYSEKEFSKLNFNNMIAVLPIAAIEQHGPHLPLSVDKVILDGLIEATVNKLPKKIEAIFLPTLPIGKSNEHAQWKGTLTFSAQTVISMCMEIGASISRTGIKKIVLLNSHGGQTSILDIVSRDLRIEYDILTVAANWFAMDLPQGIFSDTENRFGIHAGDLETSMMLALNPKLVKMSEAKNFENSLQKLSNSQSILGLSNAGKIGWQMQDLNLDGACGDASIATSEKGKAVIDHVSSKIVQLLDEVSKMPITFKKNRSEA